MPKNDQNADSRSYDLLSFCHGGKLWAPEETGHFATDCQTGRFYARELAAYMRGHTPAMLGYVVEAMAGRPHRGVEVGFFHEIALALAQSVPVPAGEGELADG